MTIPKLFLMDGLEKARIDALHRVGILDTDAEEFFDDAVALLQRITDAPMVFVSFIDADRQWIKAQRGLAVQETPRSHAFCNVTIKSDRPLVVEDAREHPDLADNPYVRAAEPVIAYLGAPVVLSGGHRIGAVCVAAPERHLWTAQDVRDVAQVARMVARHLEVRHNAVERDQKRFLEKGLKSLEDRMGALMSSMAEGIVMMGESGAIFATNPAACRILGRTEDEIFGRGSADPNWGAIRTTGEPYPGAEHPIMITLRTGEAQADCPMGVLRPSGERVWIKINTQSIRTDRQRVRQALAVFREVPREAGWVEPG
ncbi:MAG TPA: hypothetical protein DCL54_06890 [Alphaproteobacteria bacterium]|nr:hypothetical protein [Alphaproteobacteria bacterium]